MIGLISVKLDVPQRLKKVFWVPDGEAVKWR